MRVSLSSALVAALALACACAWAQGAAVQRCEGRDGSVTYSNTQCPPGTAPVRKVNTDPPVSVEASKAAQDQAKKDAAAVQQIEKQRAQEAARERKDADDRAKAAAKAKERCERATRDLERARATRAGLDSRPASVEQMQKADRDIGRREADVARDCPR
jgi:hypothetical protein